MSEKSRDQSGENIEKLVDEKVARAVSQLKPELYGSAYLEALAELNQQCCQGYCD